MVKFPPFSASFSSLRFYLNVVLLRGAAGLILVLSGVLKAPPVVLERKSGTE